MAMTQAERDAEDAITAAKRYGVDFPDRVESYRDQYIEQAVSYNSKTAINTEENRNWLAGLEQRWKAENNLETISFKQADGTYTTATLADIQGLQKEMFLREQKGRAAEAVVLANHAQTPYTDETWKTDFDEEIS